MKNSKLDLIQSISEQQQQADQLQASLQQLSKTLINFEQLIEQSEQPTINSISLLQKVQQTTIALESRISSILTEIGNLSPQAIKTLSASYTEQIEALLANLANIDTAEILKVTSSIDSFSTSIQALQTHINSQLQSISIDKQSLSKSIQAQVQQAIARQSEQTESHLQTLITEKLSSQKASYIVLGAWIFTVLMLLMTSYLGYQSSSNLKTIAAQREMIQQNSQAITNQINYLNSLKQR